jgi:hypothetical protein
MSSVRRKVDAVASFRRGGGEHSERLHIAASAAGNEDKV